MPANRRVKPILILEEKIYPSAVNVAYGRVPHHKPIAKAINFIGKNVFTFQYGIESPMGDKDWNTFSEEEIAESFDDDRLVELIQNHDIIILMGSNLCKKVLGKDLKKVIGEPQKIADKIIIPTYSSWYLHKNKKNCIDEFVLAYRHFSGDVFERDLVEYETITTVDRLKEVIEYRKTTGIVCFDYETTGFNYKFRDEYATLLSLTFFPGYSYIIPFEHNEFDWGDNWEDMLEVLRVLFWDPDTMKVAHNMKFDWHWNTRYNIPIRGRTADTMLMSHILDENRRHGLKELTRQYFPYWGGYEDEVDFKGPLDQLSKYAAQDTNITLMLYYLFERELLKDGNEKLYLLFRNLTMPAVRVFQDIEYRGCKIDRNLIIESIEQAEEYLAIKEKELSSYPEVDKFIQHINKEKIKEKIEKINAKIRKRENMIADKNPDANEDTLQLLAEADRYIVKYKADIRNLQVGNEQIYTEINFGSPAQLKRLLFDKEGFNLKGVKVDGELVQSTGREVLQEIDHPFMGTLFAYRTIAKMISTYYQGILDKLDEDDYLHGSFLLHGTVTGRLSSKNPNLQNIPSRLKYKDDEAEWCLKQVKKFFIPIDESYYVIQADYSQAELRTIANFSKDPVMIQAYLDGKDLHAITGARIAKKDLEDFEKSEDYAEVRKQAKGANFGLVYKISDDGYKKNIKSKSRVELSDDDVRNHREAIFGTYKNLYKWHATYENIAKKQGYVETMFGRRRRFLNINNSTNMGLVNKDIRDAINAPIQGTSGEFTIFTIILLWHRLPKDNFLWSTVHDSEFMYIQKHRLDLLEIVNQTCEAPPLSEYFRIKPSDMPVPMKMDYEISDKSWGHMEEIGNYDEVVEYIKEIKD